MTSCNLYREEGSEQESFSVAAPLARAIICYILFTIYRAPGPVMVTWLLQEWGELHRT